MSAAKFPASIWDGSSKTRSAAIDREPVGVVERAPDGFDWNQAVAELIAVEAALQTVTTIAGAGNTAALATTATKGFGYIPTCAGLPTGTPAGTPAGFVPWVYDTTNHKISVYDGGSWKQTPALA
jgi:hypothetical protein